MRPHRHGNLACMRDIFGCCCRLIWPFIELVRVRVLPFRRLEVKIHTHGGSSPKNREAENKLLEISNLFFWIIYRAIFHTIFFLITFFGEWGEMENHRTKLCQNGSFFPLMKRTKFHSFSLLSRSSCTLLLCSEASARNLPQLPFDCHDFDYWYLLNEVKMLLHHEAERWFALTKL